MENIISSCVNCGKKHNKSDMQWRKIDGYKSRHFGYHCTACIDKKINRSALNTTKSIFRKSAPARAGVYFTPRIP